MEELSNRAWGFPNELANGPSNKEWGFPQKLRASLEAMNILGFEW
jgi:hypothetical protein